MYLDNLILGTNNVSQNQIAFFPNPVEDILHLNSKETIDGVAVYKVTGQLVANVTYSETRNELNVAALSSGIYFVQVSSNGKIETLKVVKQ